MKKLRPKKTLKLAEQLHEQLLDWIISGTLKEGDKIPSESELCKSFSVSRPIVREALRKLQLEELVKTKKGIGTFVLHSSLGNLKPFASANDIAAILQSHEARMALETEASALAAIRRTTVQLKFIKDAFQNMQNDFNESNLSVPSDFEFHIGIARATNNEIFVTLLENLHFGLRKIMTITQSFSWENVRNQKQPDRIQQVLKEHQNILNAIEVQDPEAARIAMRYHISKVKQRLINIQSDKTRGDGLKIKGHSN
ncbi:FadR/GntR family transcriptional regulator [Pricia sp.]|uniref:FadR/GntR family transcriptional regulator n=1 Tax=Pricia sp. TaxID=2268138 RepID=UPI003592F7BE